MTFKYMATNRMGQDCLIKVNLNLEKMPANQLNKMAWDSWPFIMQTNSIMFPLSIHLIELVYDITNQYYKKQSFFLSSLYYVVHKCIDCVIL